MFIEKISIECFGNLSNKTYDLKNGINIFKGKNESGKSTVASFIKFIFYGLCGKTPDESLTVKARFTNWDSGICGGNLVISDNQKRYRIERRVVPAAKASGKETVTVIDLESGKEVFKNRIPGEVFFGVGEDIFSQTAFSAQGSGNIVNTEKLNSAIDNILFAADESTNVSLALKKLDEARTFLLHKNQKGGRIFELKNRISELEEKISVAEENGKELDIKNHKLSETKALLRDVKAELDLLEKQLEKHRASKVLEKFKTLDEKKDVFDKASKNLEVISEKCARGGFIPDEGYIKELEKLKTELTLCENELEASKVQRDAYTLTTLSATDKDVLDEVRKFGGREKAVAEIKERTKLSQKAKKASLATSMLTAVLLVLSIFLFVALDNKLISIAPAAATVLFLVLTVALGGKSKKSDPTKLFELFKATSYDSAINNIDNAIHAESIALSSSERYSHILSSLEKAEKAHLSVVERIGSELSKWELSASSVKELDNILQKLALIVDGIKKAEAALQNAKLVYEAEAYALSSLSREEAEEIAASEKEIITPQDSDISAIKLKLNFDEKRKSALEMQLRTTELEIASLSAITEDSKELCEELTDLKTLYKDYSQKHSAYLLAYDSIKRAAENLRASISPKLAEYAGKMMADVTEGKYSEIAVDNSLSPSFRADEASPTRVLGFMSEGTKALTYVSLRLALIETVFSGKKPPVVFDESFSWLDDERLSKTLSILDKHSEGGSQVIIMTCCDREYDLFDKNKSVHLVEL